MTNHQPLTVADIDAGRLDARWNGWGYLGERERSYDVDLRERADAWVLAAANADGWGRDDLFAWMNSKAGRHFGDWAFGAAVPGPSAGTYAEVPTWVYELFTLQGLAPGQTKVEAATSEVLAALNEAMKGLSDAEQIELADCVTFCCSEWVDVVR